MSKRDNPTLQPIENQKKKLMASQVHILFVDLSLYFHTFIYNLFFMFIIPISLLLFLLSFFFD